MNPAPSPRLLYLIALVVLALAVGVAFGWIRV
jgi:hypothetical protein